ncbi:MAG: competence protein ComK [bacterium]|nr:competence protein ComK [bacterium]
MEKYEINKDTLAVIGLNDGKTKVIEYHLEKILDEPAYEVMEHSCGYFGSSYQGRVEGSRNILGCNYKVPIIVEESSEIIFFPTASPSLSECSWFSLHAIESITEGKDESFINLKNGSKITLPVSKTSIENQLLRATRLKYLINTRKEAKY